MSSVNIKVDEAAIKDALATLSGIENGFVRAYARALNKTATGTRADMVKLAREDYNFKASAVRARTAINRATWSELTSAVRSKGGGVHLTDFTGTRKTSKGLTVNIKKSTGLKRILHAFTASGRNSGKLIAFWRADLNARLGPSGRKQLSAAISGGHVSPATGLVHRYPIQALYGPHPEIIYNTEENWAKLRTQADERMTAAFSDEVGAVARQYR